MVGNGAQMDDSELARSWSSVVRAVAAVQQAAAAETEALGIPFAYFTVLSVLLEAPEHRLPMSRIARDLSMTSGGFTKLADRMARDGLIDRRGSAGDRRIVFAALTDAGVTAGLRAESAYLRLLRERVLGVVDAGRVRDIAELALRLHQANQVVEPDAPDYQVTPRPDDAPERRSRGERS